MPSSFYFLSRVIIVKNQVEGKNQTFVVETNKIGI